MIVEFKKPYDFEGKKYSEIEVAVEELSGQNLINLQKRYQKTLAKKSFQTSSLAALTIDTDFILFALGELTKQPMEFFTQMPANDMLSCIYALQGFLSSGSDQIQTHF